jgi:hypothetical protein
MHSVLLKERHTPTVLSLVNFYTGVSYTLQNVTTLYGGSNRQVRYVYVCSYM